MSSIRPRRKKVKVRRAYNATSRRERARQSQENVLDIAERRFLRDGYASTTIAAIAADARVSADTIFKTFGGKPGLIRAIRARALRGVGPVPAEQRSDEMQARESDPRQIIRAWGEFVTELTPIGAPILLLLRDAASSDPELGTLLEELDLDRLRRMTENARRLASAGHLRTGLTAKDAADVLWVCSSPELYELLVLRRRMPIKRYGKFVADMMIGALL